VVWEPLSLDWGPSYEIGARPLNLITALRECKIKKKDAVMLGKIDK